MNSTAFLRSGSAAGATRNVAVIGVVSCLAIVGFAAAVTGAGPALSTQINIVSVDHTNKGDRLRSVSMLATRSDSVVRRLAARYGQKDRSLARGVRGSLLRISGGRRRYYPGLAQGWTAAGRSPE